MFIMLYAKKQKQKSEEAEAIMIDSMPIYSVPAPLQLNTQHNRYFTFPVGRTAWSRQTITRDWGEGIMILLLPHASDGVTEFGL